MGCSAAACHVILFLDLIEVVIVLHSRVVTNSNSHGIRAENRGSCLQ